MIGKLHRSPYVVARNELILIHVYIRICISRMLATRTGFEFNRARVYMEKATNLNRCTHSISVVDDSDGIRRSFRTVLEHASYRVTEYASGQEFLDSGLARQADCILLDLEMPSPNGIEVLDALQDIARATPVVVVTGTDNSALLGAAERDIVVAILKKPIGPDALLAAVARALGQTSHTD